MEIISITEIMQLTGMGRKSVTKLLKTKGCPLLPRSKNENYRVPKEAFIKWMEGSRK